MNDTDEIGQVIFDRLRDNVVFEEEDWALDRVARVNARLQMVRPRGESFQVVIPWLETFTAFTAPGRYIFVSRSLLQLCRNDEMTAFVIAHEMAHHDLGHLVIFPDWLRNTATRNKGFHFFALYRSIERRLHGPEMETAADQYALALCLNAGFDGRKCLEFFDVAQKYALDMKDLDGVFEADTPVEIIQLGGMWAKSLWTWLRQRKRGYFPITERRETLEEYYSQLLKS